MADTKAETELTAEDVKISFDEQQDSFETLETYIAQQNRAYVKRLCEKAREHGKETKQFFGWDHCADYIEREGGKDG
jgi:hypothetical protein